MSEPSLLTIHKSDGPLRYIAIAPDGVVTLHGMTLTEARIAVEREPGFANCREQAREMLAAYEKQQVRH